MNIPERAKQMVLSPQTEWPVVERETTSPQQVVTAYVVPLAAIGSIVVFVAAAIAGLPVVTAFLVAVSGFATTVASCVVGAIVADSMATTFGGTSNRQQAFKLLAYAFTPVLLAALIPIPVVGGIIRLAALIYAIYILYLGIPPLMKAPKDRAVPYTLVLVVVMFVVTMVVTMILGMMLITGSLFTDNPFRIV